MSEEDVRMVLEEAKAAMEKTLRSLRAELRRVRTGRANTALLEGIQVDYYGSPTPLNRLANLTTPEPRLIVVAPFDRGALRDIEKAILASDLGLTPSNDGKLIRIPIPPLTEERRRELVRHVHRVAEQHKLGVREARREALSMLKEMESEGELPADERHRADRRVQELTDEYIKKIEQAAEQKEQEILQV